MNIEKVDKMPRKKSKSHWKELYDELDKMEAGSVIRIQVENIANARSKVAYHKHKTGMNFSAQANGEWLYIERIK